MGEIVSENMTKNANAKVLSKEEIMAALNERNSPEKQKHLNRQQYFMEHIGTYKTDALKSLLLKINPYLDIYTDCVKVTEENLKTLFRDEPIVCEAFDNPEAKAMLVNGILEHFPEKKLVSATGMAGYGSSNTIRTQKLMKNFYLCGDRETAPTYGNGLMAPRVAICAAHEANMITRLILGEEDV